MIRRRTLHGKLVASKLPCPALKEVEIRVYVTAAGSEAYTDWERRLGDRMVRARIRARIGRLRLGHFGDAKRGGEVFELRIHLGP